MSNSILPPLLSDTEDLISELPTDFYLFCWIAFAFARKGKTLGREPFVHVLCDWVASFLETPRARYVTNLPPRHLKTFIATICATAWMLGRDPATEVLILCNNELLAAEIAGKIGQILSERWYRRAFPRTEVSHARGTDFGTTDGGRIRVVPILGKFTGIGADVIIIDDPLQIEDARDIKKMEKVKSSYSYVHSRLNDPEAGRIMLNQHRIHSDDPTAFLLRLGYKQLVLPLVATEEETFHTSRGIWTRKVGETLRPKAWPQAVVDEKKMTCINPDFGTLYQQKPGNGIEPITADCFLPLVPRPPSSAPVVLSVDPGHLAGPDNACTVIQAWCPFAGRNILLDQFRESCSFADAFNNLKKFVARFAPSTILIEATGYGPGLHDVITNMGGAKLVLVPRPTRSKPARLVPHLKLIHDGGIGLLARSACAGKFVEELIEFPHGAHDDVVDALTQFLDFIATNPALPPNTAPPVRGVLGLKSAATATPNSVPPTSVVPGLGVRASRGGAFGMQNQVPWGMPTPIEPKDTHPALVATLDGPRWKMVR